jgi:hypothetical protein
VDSWHLGAMDNGTANAAQLEIARLLATRPRYRGLRLAFWSGHSHGRYAGSAWYADQFWPELSERCAVHINVDSLGGRGADHITGAFAMPETVEVAREVLAALTGEQFVGTPPGRSGDQSFFGIGIPSLLMTVSEHPASSPGFSRDSSVAGNLGWWWHTTEDTIDKIDPANLRRDTAIYLGCVSEFCRSPVLPLDYAAAAAELAGLVRRRQAAIARGGLAVSLAGLVADAAELVEKTGELAGLRRSLAGSIADQGKVSRLNRTLMALGRVLIPVLYTRGGRFVHDPATTLAPLPSLALADDLDRSQEREELLLRAGELRRGVNRVRQALAEAISLLNTALAADR